EGICLEQMYTPHLKPYTIAEGIQMLEALNAKSPVPFYMHCDTGHMAVAAKDDENHTFRDKDPYYWLRQRYAGMGKIFVHLQQTDALASRHWPFTPEYNRKGFIEARKVIQAIEDSGDFIVQLPKGYVPESTPKFC
ncbi:MAG: hypothetical protein QW828_00410, partial [Candidatus Bathyarchaeia archaeon]